MVLSNDRASHATAAFSPFEPSCALFPQAQSKIILEDLRENAFGEFEGQRISDLVRDEAFRRWMDPAEHFTPNGGERAEDFHRRCQGVLMSILEYMMKRTSARPRA